MRLLYDIVFFLFSLAYLPTFIAKGKFGASWPQRFGRVPAEITEELRGERVLWVHAVSVGEIGLAVGFLDRLRDSVPGVRFVITATTEAGHQVARKIKRAEDILLYFPADYRFSVRSFIDSVSPEALVLFETEIWPNLIWELSSRKVPVYILNGRLSDRAFKQYQKIKAFIKHVLKDVTLIAAQDERMRERFLALGAAPSQVVVTGNVKFDWHPAHGASPEVHRLQKFCRKGTDFLCVAGSTHEGEEEILFDLYPGLKRKCPGLKLLIAPRHLNRLETIEAAAAKRDLATRRVSAEDLEPEGSGSKEEILILGQMGVLPFLYGAADVAFIGGSLVPVGGHNLVEPAYFEKPIVFGPFMDNFREMADEFKKNNAACLVGGARELELKLVELFSDRARCRSLGKAAKQLVLHHQGAAEKNRAILVSALSRTQERKLVTV